MITPVLTPMKILVLASQLALLPLLMSTPTTQIYPDSPAAALEACNVIWDTPSTGPLGSMPAGNGETGINLWVEPSGDILLYVARTDALDENERPCKLGRVRVRLSPNPVAKGFKQTLNLAEGCIDLAFGAGDERLNARVWINAHRQAVHLEMRSAQPFSVSAAVELWRAVERPFRGPAGGELREDHSVTAFPEAQRKIYPDTLVAGESDRITWYHRNRVSPWRDSLQLQELAGIAAVETDPLLHRTFGAMLTGTNLVRKSATELTSGQPGTEVRIDIVTHTQVAPELADWTAAIRDEVTALAASDRPQQWAAHRQWWHEFWARSYIFASGTPEAEAVTRAYVLQRWVQACAGRGHFPIKFNGSLFVVERNYDPDYRRWGGAYWFQNTRLIYWAMLASGDFDMMRPFFEMYFNMLPLSRERSRTYFHHAGACFPEVASFWGANLNNYGRHEPKVGSPSEWINGHYTRHHFNGMLELVALMIDYYRFTGDREFLRNRLVPFARDILLWWDRHWPLDQRGRWIIAPANALETYWNATNNLPDVAGLRWNIDQLRALPPGDLPDELRSLLDAMSPKVPELPRGQTGGDPVLLATEPPLPARMNHECPELYAVFPYRLFGVGKPDLALARATFAHRPEQGAMGWQNDDCQAAFLGLTEIARAYLVQRAQGKDPDSRFPVFWQTNYDWSPDQDHGSNLLKTLQTMLLQEAEGKILVAPAWPQAWDVTFRLHTAQQTVVSGRRQNGRWINLVTRPTAREHAIVLPNDGRPER
jgi:alpha-L-fucosidase 2